MRTWMLLALLAGCAGAGAELRSDRITVTRNDPGPLCRLIGGDQAMASSYDNALAELQKEAAQRGGDLAVIDAAESQHSDGSALGWVTVYGRIFACASGPTLAKK